MKAAIIAGCVALSVVPANAGPGHCAVKECIFEAICFGKSVSIIDSDDHPLEVAPLKPGDLVQYLRRDLVKINGKRCRLKQQHGDTGK